MGEIYAVSFGDAEILLKTQFGAVSVKNVAVASELRNCNLVNFRYFDFFMPPNPDSAVLLEEEDGVELLERGAHTLWTAMEKLDSDCSSLSEERRRELWPKFVNFLSETLKCILDHGASYADMKLQNCGICATGDAFRLIDVDSINAIELTYPAIRRYLGHLSYPNAKTMQTRYAFAVTAALFWPEDEPNRLAEIFFAKTMNTIGSRLQFLQGLIEEDIPKEVAEFIQTNGVDVLRSKELRGQIQDVDRFYRSSGRFGREKGEKIYDDPSVFD